MIRDRDYMRGPSFGGHSVTVTMVAVLIACFVVQCCLMFYGHVPVMEWFALSLDGFHHKYYWQFLTFQFLHTYPWPWHVLGNCLALYFLGRSVEEVLGKKQFLIVYFASGFFGAAVQLLTTQFLPDHVDIPVVGASAGIMGILAAFTTMFPMREITYFLYFFPITIRARYIFWAAFCFSLFGTIIPYNYTANAAHLGGLLVGVAYIRWGNEAQRRLARLSPFQSRERNLEMVKAPSARGIRPARPGKDLPTEIPSDEFISREVDPILDKISAHGIQSLTPRERQILEAARSRMSRH
jgi:membrane associated rhomboid family serine protease